MHRKKNTKKREENRLCDKCSDRKQKIELFILIKATPIVFISALFSSFALSLLTPFFLTLSLYSFLYLTNTTHTRARALDSFMYVCVFTSH